MDQLTCCKHTGSDWSGPWDLGGIARSGVYFSKGSTSLTGYDTEPEGRFHELGEGGHFVDKREVESIASAVFAAPLSGFVPIEEYLTFWREQNARIGFRQDNHMVWEDGTSTPIEPCKCWKGICMGCDRLRYYVDRLPSELGAVKIRDVENQEDHCPACKAANERSVA